MRYLLSLLCLVALSVSAKGFDLEVNCPASVQCSASYLTSCNISSADQQYWGEMEAGGKIVAATYNFSHTNWTSTNNPLSASCIYKYNDKQHGDSYVYVHNKTPLQPSTQRASNWYFSTKTYASCLGPINTNCPYSEMNSKK
jgi:hypothetical protein